MASPIIRRVDHLLIRVEDPKPLLDLFFGTFGWPVAWPLKDQGSFASGGAFVGNAAIEVVRLGRVGRAPDPRVARFFGIAFEPVGLAEGLRLLASRGIPHSPPIPFRGEDHDGVMGILWTNVVLGRMVGEGMPVGHLGRRFGGDSRLNFFIGKAMGRVLSNRWGSELATPAPESSMIFLCQYTHDVGRSRRWLRAELNSRRGGPLGVDAIEEVRITVVDHERAIRRWGSLLEPVPSDPSGCWRPGEGPSIRMVPGGEERLETIVIRVRSLSQARAFLEDRGMVDESCEEGVKLKLPTVQGLDIRLVGS